MGAVTCRGEFPDLNSPRHWTETHCCSATPGEPLQERLRSRHTRVGRRQPIYPVIGRGLGGAVLRLVHCYRLSTGHSLFCESLPLAGFGLSLVILQSHCDEVVGVGLAASEDLGVDAVHDGQAVACAAGYFWGFDSRFDPEGDSGVAE